jgi:GH24 family phage-related lysozyme (muramidase)
MRVDRRAIGALTLSAGALVALLGEEWYTEKAIIPTKNDRWTVGFGSTFKEDGSPVQKGDTITPPKAVARTYIHIAKDESKLKQCVKAPLSQVAYDLLVKFSYQYGPKATCSSSMVKHINAGQYAKACDAYLLYKYSGGYDCSIPGNKICAGVWTRQLERQAQCKEAQ